MAREQDTNARTIVLDYTGMVTPQMSRFFAAVTAVTMGPDKALTTADRQLGTAGGALTETVGARSRKDAGALSGFERELAKFRAAVDRQQ